MNIGRFSDYTKDFAIADKLAPNGSRDVIKNTWHHCEDGCTMQEIDKVIHKQFTHRGGMAKKKGNIK